MAMKEVGMIKWGWTESVIIWKHNDDEYMLNTKKYSCTSPMSNNPRTLVWEPNDPHTDIV